MPPHKWEEIAEAIRQHLGAPGSTLPSETELAEEHRAVRNTVRQALNQLESEGRIVTTHGQRRVVRDIRRWRYDMNRLEQRHGDGVDAWTATMLEQGAVDPETTVEVRSVLTSPEVGRPLAIPADRPIISRQRTHWVAGYPHMLSSSYYPRFVTDGHDNFLHPENVSAKGGLLAASGHRQARFLDLISTRLPSTEETSTLRMPTTIPLLVHSRTGYDEEGRPVRLEVRRMPSDQVEVTYSLANE